MDDSVFHLLPSLSIGGAESLVLNSVININKKRKYFLVFFDSVDLNLWQQLSVEQKKHIIIIKGRFTISRYIKSIVFLHKNRSSIIITSLWKSVLIVYLYSFVFKLKKHVAFIHRSTTAHFFDGFFRKWQINNSILQLADSLPTKNWVISNCLKPNVFEIPLLFKSDQTFAVKKTGLIKFCYIGRLSKVKNIGKVLELMKRLYVQLPNSVFDIYGTDQGELHLVNKFIKNNHLDKIITYKGFLMPWEIKNEMVSYHYIISLSHTEGMAMSVAEAMQAGVVPIAGNVGGPSEYCRHLINSFMVFDYSDGSLDAAVKLVAAASNDEIEYNKMSRAAYDTFSNSDFYEESFEKLLLKISV